MSTPTISPEQSIALVMRVLGEVLGDATALTTQTRLLEEPRFDSIALATVIEGLEAALGFALLDELIIPEVFASPATIAVDLVAPALRKQT